MSMLLSLAAIGLILFAQWPMLAAIQPRGFFGMLCLLAVSLGIGWWLGGPGVENRKAMSLTTSLRNVGVGLVIATGNFANTPAVTAVLAYGLIQIFGSLGVAMVWGRKAAITERSTGAKDEMSP
jgi:BASS family bile acid:Na+ symporter